MRLRAAFALLPAALLLAACSSSEEPSPADPAVETSAPAPSSNQRGAAEAAVGEPVQRSDGAYTLTLTDVVAAEDCDTYGEDISPSTTGDKLIIATFDVETSATPLTSSYLMPLDFYSVTEGRIAGVPSIGGVYQCEGGVEGRESMNQPLPNATFERIETFMIPVGAEMLGYRDPETREAFEWVLPELAAAPAAVEPGQAVTAPAVTTPPTTEAPAPAPAPVVNPPVGYTGAPNGAPQPLVGKAIDYCMTGPMYQTGTTMFTDGTTGWTQECSAG